MTAMKRNDTEPLTDEERESWPKAPKVSLEKPFTDRRGKIQPLVDLMMKSAVMIESKRGSLRANHYHKTDWHYCYVISGCIEYYHRPTGSTAAPEKATTPKPPLFSTVTPPTSTAPPTSAVIP